MRIKSLLFLARCTFAVLLNASYANDITKPSQENIQVLLEEDATEALLEVRGPYYIFNPKDGSRITSGLLGKRFLVHPGKSGIKWGEEFLGIYQIYVVPRSEETSILVNGIQYEGAIAVFVVGDKINVVNEVNIEDFITSILTVQFPYPLEAEVMSSVAILARTDAYFRALKNADSYWHLEAKEARYLGCALNSEGSFIEKVVDSTRNLVLVHSEKGKNVPFPATWTEHSGGKTASFSAIFRKDIPFSEKGVEAPHAKLDRDDSKWHFSITKNEFADLFSLSGIKSIELFIDKESNKAYGVRLKGPNFHKDVSFFDFQGSLGKERLLSNDFEVQLKGEEVIFTGFGKGHGVGLCIYSASAMAQNGENAVKILSKFFPETFLMNLSALPVEDSSEMYRKILD